MTGKNVAAKEPARDVGALAAFLAERLKALGMTPTEFAEHSGISRSTVYRLLGDRPPERVTVEQLTKLAAALDIDVTDLTALWGGAVHEVVERDERGDVVKSFLLATRHLSADELRDALDIAKRAAKLATRDESLNQSD